MRPAAGPAGRRLGHDPATVWGDVGDPARASWAAEEARVTREFRALAERMGTLRPERGRDTDPEVRARRDDVWAEVSDGSRAMLFSMADPTVQAGGRCTE